MSKAYKCTICGTYTDEYYQMVIFSDVGDETVDLCPAHREEFKDWKKGGKSLNKNS